MKFENCPPTWEAAMRIYCATIEKGSDASEDTRQDAKEDMIRCGRLLDEAQKEIKVLKEKITEIKNVCTT